MTSTFDQLIHFAVATLRGLTNDLEDGQLADQPAPGINHPAWILGHLAVTSDFGLRMLGVPARCPKEWYKLFGMGSKPTSERSAYPPAAELWDALKTGYRALGDALRTAPPEKLQAAHTIPFLTTLLPTVGDVVAHLLTTHLALHTGQLSMWRRLKGLPPLV